VTADHVRWLNAAAAAHGPALKALRNARRALWNQWHEKPKIGAEAEVAEIDEAIKLMEQAPEPEP
jgi:hypothetical protein